MQFVIQPPVGDNFLLPVEPTVRASCLMARGCGRRAGCGPHLTSRVQRHALPSPAVQVDFAVVKALCASRLGLHPSTIRLFNAASGAEYVDGSFVSKVPNLSSIRVEIAAAPPPYSSGAAAAPVAPVAAATAATATASAGAAAAAAAPSSVPAATPYTDPADECSICLETYAPTHPPVALKCGHAFHEVCVRQWAQNSAYCPLCRRKIELVAPAAAAAAGGGAAAAAAAAPAVPDRSASSAAATAAAVGGAAAAAPASTGKAPSPAASGAAATGVHTTTVAALPMPGTGMTLYIVDNGTGTPPTPEEVSTGNVQWQWPNPRACTRCCWPHWSVHLALPRLHRVCAHLMTRWWLQVELALAATRKQLAANSEHSGLLKAVKDFKER